MRKKLHAQLIPFHILVEGNGFKAQQTSEEQTKMTRFVLEGLQPSAISCFVIIHTKHELHSCLILA